MFWGMILYYGSTVTTTWSWCVPSHLRISALTSHYLPSYQCCLQAIFGFLPTHVDDSLWNVIVYNAFPVECKFDKQGAIKSTWANVGYYIRNFVVTLCVLGMYCSLLVLFDYKLYPTEEGPELRDISLYNALNWHQLANNFSIASEYFKMRFICICWVFTLIIHTDHRRLYI